MDEAIEWNDDHLIMPNRVIYTFNEMGIPGLTLMGWHHSHCSRHPLTSHIHRDCIEITLMIKGNIFFIAEGKEFHIKGGDVFITPANLPHCGAATHTNSLGPSEFYWTQLHTGDPSFLFLRKKWAADIHRMLGNLQVGIYHNVNFIRKKLAMMFFLLGSASDSEKLHGCSQLVNLLYEIAEAQKEMRGSLSEDIQKTVDLIRANLYEEIMLESLAEEIGLSLSRFKHKFQKQVGMSPRMFINLQKIEEAQKLLVEGKSITDAAFDLGYNSSSYFSTVFQKFTQLSPSKFIQKESQK